MGPILLSSPETRSPYQQQQIFAPSIIGNNFSESPKMSFEYNIEVGSEEETTHPHPNVRSSLILVADENGQYF